MESGVEELEDDMSEAISEKSEEPPTKLTEK